MKWNHLHKTLRTATLIGMSSALVTSCAIFKKDAEPEPEIVTRTQSDLTRPAPTVAKPKPKVTTPKPASTSYSHRTNPSSNLPVKSAAGVTHYSGNPGLPYIALTFDDGPHPVHTPKLLNTLKSHNVKATFYVTGQNASRYPSIIRRIVNEGHEIGNHTYTHPNLTKLSDAAVRSQLDKSVSAIVSAAGVKPRTFRPPYGALTSRQRSWINSQYGYPIIFWSVDPKDWKDRNSSLVTSRLLNGTKKGGILLLHDIHATSVQAVPQTINGLLSKGYKFVTVSQLLGAK